MLITINRLIMNESKHYWFGEKKYNKSQSSSPLYKLPIIPGYGPTDEVQLHVVDSDSGAGAGTGTGGKGAGGDGGDGGEGGEGDPPKGGQVLRSGMLSNNQSM